jgi:hypothetical protein
MVDRVEVTQEENNPSLEEQAKTQEAETPATPETQTQEVSDERPGWLPEKFANAEELAKAYGELEKRMSSKPTEEKPVETKDLKIEAKEEVKTENSLDPFYAEYAEKGQLTDESYTKLASMGINKETVDAYISGQEALAQQHNASIVSTVGGQENYNNMVQWASQNLSKAEIDAFNNTVDNGSLEQAQLAIAGVNSKFQASTREPNLFSGQKTESNVGYDSVAQMLTDINNPKYKEDSAFRSQVEAKVKQSNIL